MSSGSLLGPAVAVAGASAAITSLPKPANLIVAGATLGLGGWLAWRGDRAKPVARLGGFSWSREDFCRHWLITGDTGSGKTRSAINRLLYEVFTNEPTWGGLCIDDKGLYWETLMRMARHFGREQDVVLLRVGFDPKDGVCHRFNLTSDRTIPFLTYGRMIVDTAVAMGQNRDQSFFRTQAQSHIAKALEALHLLGIPVTLENAFNLLQNPVDLNEALRGLQTLDSTAARELATHFLEQFSNQPAEQKGGVSGTIFNYLNSYTAPEVAEVFCRDSTFNLAEVDSGKIVCLAMPQKFATERRYLCTMLKQLFFLHVLRRFDKPAAERAKDNLLVLWADEAQHFVTAGEEGMSDYSVIDRLREARGAVVMATQSTTSFVPPLGREKARVLTLNLRNRVIFKATDEEDAVASADFIGKRKRTKYTWTRGPQGRSSSATDEDVHKIKSYRLRALRKHRAVIVHCEKGFRRAVLPPLEPNGSVSPWFDRWSF